MTQAAPRNSDTNELNNVGGGLNTMSSVGSYPVGDSPLLDNIVVTDKGTGITRKGTYLAKTLDCSCKGSVVIPYQTKAGNVLLVIKEGVHLRIYALTERPHNVVTAKLVVEKLNVWSSDAEKVRPSYVITNEGVPRIIMFTGINAPVQLTMVEGNAKLESSYVSSFDIESIYYHSIDSSSAVAFCNGYCMDIDTVSYSAGVATFNLVNEYDLADSIYNYFGYEEVVADGLFITWQWLCEGDIVSGDKLYDTTTRFNANDADLGVAVPVTLLNNVEPLKNGVRGFPVIPYNDNEVGSYSTHANSLKPSAVNEFTWSSGLFYKSSENTTPRPNFSHVTYGALDASGDPSEISFVRCFPLRYSEAVDPAYLHVRVNGVPAVARTQASTYDPLADGVRAYHLRKDVSETADFFSAASILPTTTEDAEFITFDAQAGFGLGKTDVVEIVYARPNHIGLAASSTPQESFLQSLSQNYVQLVDGQAYPIFGIQEHADYENGTFPSCAGFFQGRLVMSGFASDPTKVVFSEVKGTSLNTENFVNYSMLWNDFGTFEPIAVAIAADSNESFVTGLTESSGSLIVFTRSQCFRVHGGSSALSNTTVIVSRISSIGCVNTQSFVSIDNAVYFLSESGLFRLSPSIEIGDFTITNFSQKINDELKVRVNYDYAFVSYDKKRSLLYIGVCQSASDTIATRLFVYNILIQAFFEYKHFTGSWMCASMCFENLNLESYTFFLCKLPTSNYLFLISHPYFFHTDFSLQEISSIEVVSSGGSGSSSVEVTSVMDRIPVIKETGSFKYNIILFDQLRAGKVNNLKDLELTINGDVVQFGQDYFKHDSKTLLVDITDSGTYEVIPIDDRGVYPLRVHVNQVLLDDSEYVLSHQDEVMYDIVIPALEEVDTYRAGYSIPYALATPEYIRGDLSNKGFNSEMWILLRNTEFRDLWADVADPGIDDAYRSVLRNFQIVVSLNVIAVLDNSEIVGVKTEQLLGTSVVTWDDLSFDYQPTRGQFNEYAKIGASPKGSNNVIQNVVQTFSDYGFEIINYQTTISKNRRAK